MTAKQAEKEADEAGIARRTVLRAKARLGVQSRREQGQDGQWQWVWYLPPVEAGNIATSKAGNLAGKAAQNSEDGQDCQISNVATLPVSEPVDLTLPECLRVENWVPRGPNGMEKREEATFEGCGVPAPTQ